MASFRLPRLKANLAIVSSRGTPLDYFLRFWNIDVAPRIEAQEELQNQQITDIQTIIAQLQGVTQSAQQAQQTANAAQASADAAAGDGTQSGSAQNPSINLFTADWISGPIVNLTGVAAGNLTITGSGPQQDNDVTISGQKSSMACEFRVVEIVGGVDSVVFTGGFTVRKYLDEETASVTNDSTAQVSEFVSARTSTGDVSYRIDARGTGQRQVTSLFLYLFVRRA